MLLITIFYYDAYYNNNVFINAMINLAAPIVNCVYKTLLLREINVVVYLIWHSDEYAPNVNSDIQQGYVYDFQVVLEMNAIIQDRQIHHQLKADLVNYIWDKFESQAKN